MTTETSNKLVKHNESDMRAMSVPQDLDHMYNMVERAFHAKLVPTSFKDVESAFIAALKGAEFGLLPFQSLAGFYVIGNIAHPYGTCVRGIVQASSQYEGDMDGCIEGLAELEYMAQEPNEYTEASIDFALFRELQRHLKRRLARIRGNGNGKLANALYFCGYSVVKRKGQEPYCVLFDTNDAHKAGLTDKDMWKKWPVRMYMHRAATFARRDRFSAALVGLEATVEEMQDAITVEAIEVQRPNGNVEPRPRTTGEVLDHFAGEREPVTARVIETTYTMNVDLPKATEPPAPAGGFVPVGEPGSDEKEDKAVPAAEASPPPPTPEAKTNGNGSKGPGAVALKAASDKLKAKVTDKAQLDAMIVDAKKGAGIPEYLRASNMNDEQKAAMAEQIEEHLARLAAEETASGGDPDPTDF